MLHVGLDLSRRRLDVCVLSDEGELVEELAAPPDAEGLRYLVEKLSCHRQPVRAVIESMTGARFVHDTLERLGWDVLIADAQRVKGLAPVACKTDRVDSRVLAVLSHRDLVPAIWLPDPRVRREREQARFRLHLVKHKSMLKHRIHSTLMTFGHPCPVTDPFGLDGRKLLDQFEIPDPWRETVDASLYLIDYLESEIAAIERELRASGADHSYVPLLLTVPGIGWVPAFTIAAEIGDITRFPSAKKAGRLHRPVPQGPPVRRLRPPRPVVQARPEIPAVGDARSDHARTQAPRLPRTLPAHQATPRQTARRPRRARRPRAKANRGDLAHAHHQPAFRSRRCGRRHLSSDRPNGPSGIAPPQPASDVAWSSTRRR